VLGELRPRATSERRPRAVDGGRAVFSRRDRPEVDLPLVRHLEEQKVGDLFDVVAVIDAVMP
jgi:hypothetical protein